jgi:hypothetical protein
MKERTLEDWQKLILEQYDTSYRERRRRARPKPIIKTEIVEKVVASPVNEEAKKIFFHAGRFAGGARDRLACEAYRELQRAGEL